MILDLTYFGLIQQFGICSGLNEVYQLLWRLTTLCFGRRNSLCEFFKLEFIFDDR